MTAPIGILEEEPQVKICYGPPECDHGRGMFDFCEKCAIEFVKSEGRS